MCDTGDGGGGRGRFLWKKGEGEWCGSEGICEAGVVVVEVVCVRA